MNFKNLSIFVVCVFAMASCSAPNKVIYLPEAEKLPTEILSQKQVILDPVLSPGDLLNIRVFASDMVAVAPFNKGQYLSDDGKISSVVGTNSSAISTTGAEASTDYYLVNTEGYIEMPMLGELKVAGKTKEEFAEEIRDMIYPKFVKVQPTVEVRLMNFRVTVLGAVSKVGQVSSKNERMNVLEAIALAGDLTMQGDRETVMLYRTNADGSREVHRLNLHDRNLLLSPYFNLQQNDVVYVEPNRSARQNAWQMHQGWTTTISVVSGLSAIASLVIGIVNLSKD
jgi:polysaccharide export outer membrane protein